MSGRQQINSWGDPLGFSPTQSQEYPGPSSHAEMSWTVCYDDDCEIHLREKQGSGWFPQKKNRKYPRRGKGKWKGGKRDLDEDDPENRPWGDRGDAGGCPIPTEEEVKVILARKAAREAAEAKAAAAMAGTKKEAEIEKVEEEQAKPKIRIAEQVKPKVVPEVKSDWAEKIRELLAGDIKPKANGGVRLNSSKYTPNSSVGSPAETVVKPASSTENVTPAPEKSRYRGWEGRLASPSRTTIAPANSKPGSEKKQSATPATPILAPTKSNATVEKKQFTSPPNTTAKTSQKTHITSPPTPTTTSTKHNPTFEKKRIFPPLLPTIHTTEIFTPRQVKQQSTSPPTTTSSQKQPLQPRKDQDKTKSGPNPSSKMSYQNAPVIPLRTALIAARVAAAAKAKHAAGREGKLPHMDKCKQVVGAKAGVV